MMNVRTNKRPQAYKKPTVPAFQKKKLKTIQPSKTSTHNNRLYNSELSYNSTQNARPDYIHLPYSQFRSRLISYLCQNQQHLKIATDQGQIQGLRSSCQWSNIKKQLSHSCKHQTKTIFNKRSFKKKNIKQYISEVALAKRKKIELKAEPDSEEEAPQLKFKTSKSILIGSKAKRKEISLIISKQPQSLERLIPIHHTQAYFYEKDSNKQLNQKIQYNHRCQTQPLQPVKDQAARQLQAYYLSYKRSSQSRIKIEVQDEKVDPFQGKFEENQKLQRLNEKVSNSCPKRATVVRRIKMLKKSEEEMNQISPWRRRRNTVDSEPSHQQQ